MSTGAKMLYRCYIVSQEGGATRYMMPSEHFLYGSEPTATMRLAISPHGGITRERTLIALPTTKGPTNKTSKTLYETFVFPRLCLKTS